MAIVVASHNLSEVSALEDDSTILRQGRVVFQTSQTGPFVVERANDDRYDLNVALEPSAAHSKLRVITVILGTYHSHSENCHHVQLETYSTGPTSESDFLEFDVFPHDRIDSFQGYFDFLDTI